MSLPNILQIHILVGAQLCPGDMWYISFSFSYHTFIILSSFSAAPLPKVSKLLYSSTAESQTQSAQNVKSDCSLHLALPAKPNT